MELSKVGGMEWRNHVPGDAEKYQKFRKLKQSKFFQHDIQVIKNSDEMDKVLTTKRLKHQRQFTDNL
jgi:hypothetical protein